MTTDAYNVDHTEVDKFDALASRWWDPGGELKSLHDINPLRLGYIESRSPLAGKQVIDVGCGGGILAESMALQGATVTGIDAGTAPLEAARLHGLVSGIKVDYQQMTAEQMASQAPESFDVVTCLELLEHVPDPGSVIAACARMVRPGGHVFFSTINRNPKSWLFAIVAAEYMLRILPRGTHDFAKLIRPSELAQWIRATDLHLLELQGMGYNPLSRQYSLEDDIDVNYLCFCVKE